MKRIHWQIALVAIMAAVATAANGEDGKQPAVIPLKRAHAHNDYLHPRPLLDALDHGFCSVEADIWLVDGRLLVGHDQRDLKQDRTLQSLYLDPLRKRAKENVKTGGFVFPGGTPIIHLLIDIKSDAEPTYRALANVLGEYDDILFEWTGRRLVERPIQVTVSGNRPQELMRAEKQRYAGIDGRLTDLDSDKSPELMPLISDNWTKHFRWNGKVAFDDAERKKLRDFVDRAHSQKRRIRFWNTPETRAAWKELYDAGVDLINTDDLEGLQKFLLEQQSSK